LEHPRLDDDLVPVLFHDDLDVLQKTARAVLAPALDALARAHEHLVRRADAHVDLTRDVADPHLRHALHREPLLLDVAHRRAPAPGADVAKAERPATEPAVDLVPEAFAQLLPEAVLELGAEAPPLLASRLTPRVTCLPFPFTLRAACVPLAGA